MTVKLTIFQVARRVSPHLHHLHGQSWVPYQQQWLKREFRKPMVNHNQERVKARGGWQVSDQVTRDLLERLGGEEADGSEGGNGGMGV